MSGHMDRYAKYLELSHTLKSKDKCLERLNDLLAGGKSSRINRGPVELTSYLFCGSRIDAHNIPLLRRLGITHVLNCAPIAPWRNQTNLTYGCTLKPPSSQSISSSSSTSSSPRLYSSSSASYSSITPKSSSNFSSPPASYLNSSRRNRFHRSNINSADDNFFSNTNTDFNSDPYYGTDYNLKSYLELDTLDNVSFPILRGCYEKAKRFIDSAKDSGGKALVHCELGMNRSITLCLAYVVDRTGLSLLRAVQQVLMDRPNILTNEGFREQLVEFSRERNLAN